MKGVWLLYQPTPRKCIMIIRTKIRWKQLNNHPTEKIAESMCLGK
jgi:hypothetical protein